MFLRSQTVSKYYAIGFYVKQAASIFSSTCNDAPCLTFLSKWPSEKSIVPGNPSTLPLVSTEESKTEYFNILGHAHCCGSTGFRIRRQICRERERWGDGRRVQYTHWNKQRTRPSCSMLQAAGICGGLCPKKANPLNAVAALLYGSNLSRSLLLHVKDIVFRKTWCKSRDKLTCEEGEKLLSI